MLDRDAAARRGQAAVGQVGQDAQVDAAAGQPLEARRQPLAGGVDGVGAHGVAHVDDQVHDQHRADGGLTQDPGLEVTRPAAQPGEHRVDAIDLGQDLGLMVEHAPRRASSGSSTSST